MKIYLDFDGTVVEHQYPKMGRCNYGSVEIIRKLQDAGHEIILNTYRADCNNGTLELAIEYLNNAWMVTVNQDRDFALKAFTHTTLKYDPPVFNPENFKKRDLFFIDDRSPGTPLKRAVMSDGWMVDWDELDRIFTEMGMYNAGY